MNIQNHIKNNLLLLKVIPHSGRSELVEQGDEQGQSKKESGRRLKLYLKSPPEKNKANQELIKFFKKEYNLKVKIKSGEKSREKVLEIL